MLFISLALMSTGCATAAGPLGIGIFSVTILCLALFTGACESKSEKESYRIFITATPTNGYTGESPGTTEGADGFCTDDDNNPDDGATFKAMIGTSDSTYFRDRTQNWVLKASSQYTRLDGTVIGTTDAEAKFNLPLENSMGDTGDMVWTGLNNDMTASNTDCGDWWYTTTSYEGDGGYVNQTGYYAWNGGTAYCDAENYIICVEQEPTAE